MHIVCIDVLILFGEKCLKPAFGNMKYMGWESVKTTWQMKGTLCVWLVPKCFVSKLEALLSPETSLIKLKPHQILKEWHGVISLHFSRF